MSGSIKGTTRDTAEEGGDLVGDQQFIEINLFGRFAERWLWIACADALIIEVEGEVFPDGDLLKLHGCLKDEHPASQTRKTSGVSFLRNTSQLTQVDIENIANSLPKNKAPRQPEGLARNSYQTTFKEGMRLSRTGNSNLTT